MFSFGLDLFGLCLRLWLPVFLRLVGFFAFFGWLGCAYVIVLVALVFHLRSWVLLEAWVGFRVVIGGWVFVGLVILGLLACLDCVQLFCCFDFV